MLWIKDGKIYRSGGVVVGGMRHFNPSPEQFIAAGYTEYVPPVPEPDPEEGVRRAEFEAACVQFKQICALIQQFAGLESFTGGFDEAMQFIQSQAFAENMVQGTYLFSLWQGADKAATYAASKIGLGQPEWWYECWAENDNQVTDDPADSEESESPEEPESEEPSETSDSPDEEVISPVIEDSEVPGQEAQSVENEPESGITSETDQVEQ